MTISVLTTLPSNFGQRVHLESQYSCQIASIKLLLASGCYPKLACVRLFTYPIPILGITIESIPNFQDKLCISVRSLKNLLSIIKLLFSKETQNASTYFIFPR